MYYNGQIVYDLDKQTPVKVGGTVADTAWAWSNLPKVSVNFRDSDGNLALPKSVGEALDLLKKGKITPAPWPVTHCRKCGHWIDNCKRAKKCEG